MTMYLVGGGPVDGLDEVYDQFLHQVRSRGNRIAVALLGSQDEVASYLDNYAEPLTKRFAEAMIEPIWLTDEDEGPIEWPADPDGLAGIVVAGGWTPGYLDALSSYRDLLARLIRGGVPYLGFSAGAMIVAKHAIVGGWRYHGRQVAPEVVGEGSTELVIRDGLGLIGPSIEARADTHTVLARAIAAMEAGSMNTVAAIDDATCLLVDTASGQTRVLGLGRVTWLTRQGSEIVIRWESALASENPQE